MANIKISELNELEQVDNDDLLVIVDTSANETKKVKARNVGTGGGGSDVVIISDTQPTSEDNKIWIDTGEVGESFTEITNEYSTSTGKGYSANYINELNTYSTTEQRIGTWIDGKPLYRKVITLSQTIPSNTSSSSAAVSIFNFASNNAKEVIVEDCRVENSDASVILYVPYAGGQPRYITIAKVSGNINLSFFNAFSNESVKIVATLKYTKTTD